MRVRSEAATGILKDVASLHPSTKSLGTQESRQQRLRSSTNNLNLLTRVKLIGNLQLLHKRNIFLLRLIRGQALVDDFLPGGVFGLALYIKSLISFILSTGAKGKGRAEGRGESTFKSNMPGLGAAAKSSAFPTL